MKFALIAIFSLLTAILVHASKVVKSSAPLWVKTIKISDQSLADENSGYQYLLIDLQENLIKEHLFSHYAIKVLDAEGIQTMSDIEVIFDPTFQKLQFHQIRILRNGEIIDKLDEANIQVFQRETNHERYIYDGSLTALINLSDVRKNDIIEYSYSKIGFNPIYKGQVSTSFYHQFTIPVNKVYNRLIAKSNQKLAFKFFNEAVNPVLSTRNGQTEYVWDLDAKESVLYDNNVPAWLDIQKHITATTFRNWQQVVNWALPLYTYDDSDVEKIKETLQFGLADESEILSLIRIVQDDIRYLGFESGIGAYKPHSPLQVFNQRFGDCKDKSLLLVALLRSEGISAYPLLVNTQFTKHIDEFLPGINVFDHCVVQFTFKGKNYYIDPTISNQGGNLEHMYFPDYGSGLLIKPGQKNLIEIPESTAPSILVTETITTDSIGGSGFLSVITKYTGSTADYIRAFFKSSTTESIQKEYLNLYSHLYPKILVNKHLELFDTLRNTSNHIFVKEYYEIENLWLLQEDETLLYCETYPIILESYTDYPHSSARTMPYYLGQPYTFCQTTNIKLPEAWRIEDFELSIDEDAFIYKNLIEGRGNEIDILHEYTLKKNYIPADSVEEFLSKNQDIQNEFSYFLTYDQNEGRNQISWISVFLAVFSFTIASYFAILLYKKYNPLPYKYAQAQTIGGWLILPAIGVTISPIVLLVQIFTNEHFLNSTWQNLYYLDTDQLGSMLLLLGFEIVYNFVLLVFTILIIVLFYQRRTSLPKLITVLYIMKFLGPLADILFLETVLPGQFFDSSNYGLLREISFSIIGAAIWIPYFNMSERVENTFCFRYKHGKTICTEAESIDQDKKI